MDPISILMLEDSALDAELVVAHLRKEEVHHTAERVSTEAEFRRALETRAFDLILSDYSLPGFGGEMALEIAGTLRPHLPFIFISGTLGEEVAVEMLKRGATDYVLKHRLDRLVPAIRRAQWEVNEVRRREKAERDLRHSESRYRLLAEAIPQLVWIGDANRDLVFINQQFCSYTGMDFKEAIAGGWQMSLHPDDLTMIEEAWTNAETDLTPFEFEFRLRHHPDGSYRWHLGRVTPIFDEDGRLSQWLGTGIDVDSQKRTEEALRQSNEELQQFAFAASHDLQEPLRNISAFAQLLARRFEHRLDEEADEYIGYVVDGAKRMTSLVHDLLSFSRISREDARVHLVPMELVLDNVLNNLRTSIAESEALITWDPMPELMGNLAQLSQVLQNLIGNSIKYRHPARRLAIHISAAESPSEWIFNIRDNGQGFDGAYADRVFGVFHRLHGRDVPGTGIGLAICKRIVEQHGGHIWAVSEHGKGATFSFTVPNISAPSHTVPDD